MCGASMDQTRGRVVGPLPVVTAVVGPAPAVFVVGLVVGDVVEPPPNGCSPGIDADWTKYVPPSPVVLAVRTSDAPSSEQNASALAANGSKRRRPPARLARDVGCVVLLFRFALRRFTSASPAAPDAANCA